MTSPAISSQGTTIGRGDGASPEVFTTIPGASNIDGPSASAAEVEVTDLSSTAKEFIAGLVDYGEISLDLFYKPDNTVHQAMLTDFDARTIRNYKITFPTSPTYAWTVAGFIKSFPPAEAVDQAVQAKVVIRCTGAATRA